METGIAGQLESAIVRIRSTNDRIVGVGFLVGKGQVLTCAHVIIAALDLQDLPSEAPRAAVRLDFPLVMPGRPLTAHVIFWQPPQPDGKGDIAGLRLDSDPPEGTQSVPLVMASDLWQHHFQAFGFPAGHDNGVWASGELRKQTAAGWVQIEDVKVTGYFVMPGFSGGPVWDDQLKAVVGMIVAAERRPEVKAAFIIPTDTLVLAWPELKKSLRPAVSNLPPLIDDWTQGFVGREYVFTAIKAFLADQPQGYFTIVGDPGMGKTAILAEYVRRTNCVAHFNIRFSTAAQFLESICAQLAARYGLPSPTLPSDIKKYDDFFRLFLDDVGARLKPDERLVIAIDALDEVDLTGHIPGRNILCLPRSLPKGIYCIMTRRRRVNLPLVIDVRQHPFDLLEHHDESAQDVRTYIRRAVERSQLGAWIDAKGLTVENFITTLAEKSENNFMYLRYVLPDIERGIYQGLGIESIPAGLEGYYEDHWQRMGMTARPLPSVKIKIVYVLAEVRQPVPRSFIAGITGDTPLMVQEVLDEWGQFLHDQQVEGQKRYSVYHTSFREFLHRKDIVQAAGVTIEDINALIASNISGRLFGR